MGFAWITSGASPLQKMLRPSWRHFQPELIASAVLRNQPAKPMAAITKSRPNRELGAGRTGNSAPILGLNKGRAHSSAPNHARSAWEHRTRPGRAPPGTMNQGQEAFAFLRSAIWPRIARTHRAA